jgi:large subunit ribosomal protein L6
MSRIGKKNIVIPKGIEVTVNDSVISVSKGKSVKTVDTLGRVNVTVENGEVNFTIDSDTREAKAFWGTYRALTANAIEGLEKGFEKKLEINGVGYRAAVKGNILELQLGFSHPVNYEIPSGVTIAVDKNVISIKSDDKQQVGQIAAEIRAYRPPEPYKGKGVKYSDEVIVRKAGKTGK